MDWHLNCFYTYNHSNELIENNLTRAFVITLQLLTEETRYGLLKALNIVSEDDEIHKWEFALQSNILKNPIEFESKRIVTISSNTALPLRENYHALGSSTINSCLKNKFIPTELSSIDRQLLENIMSGSIPDGWIYSKDGKCCHLLECKVGGNPLDYAQIIRHAYENYGMTKLADIENVTTRLTWIDVLEAIDSICNDRDHMEALEYKILQHLSEYLGFFGYMLFKGFSLGKLKKVHPFRLVRTAPVSGIFKFDRIKRINASCIVGMPNAAEFIGFGMIKKMIPFNIVS